MRVCLVGATGRMGQGIIECAARKGVRISACCVEEKALDGKMAKEVFAHTEAFSDGAFVTTEKELAFANADAVIDFSTPESFSESLDVAASCGVPLVSGVTRLTEKTMRKMDDAAKKTKVCWSSNMSIEVIIMSQMVRKLGQQLADFDCEITEAHHSKKKDSPSGTAILLGESVATGRGVDFEKATPSIRSVRGLREKGEIGFSSVRGGNIVGKHRVSFIGEMCSLSIEHEAFDRKVFCLGAIDCAVELFKNKDKSGFFSIEKLFGLY